MGTNWGPNSFAPEFWSKIEFGTPSIPLYLFCAQFQVSSPILAKLGVLMPSFNGFTDNFILEEIP
jgi:hypothetical protein